MDINDIKKMVLDNLMEVLSKTEGERLKGMKSKGEESAKPVAMEVSIEKAVPEKGEHDELKDKVAQAKEAVLGKEPEEVEDNPLAPDEDETPEEKEKRKADVLEKLAGMGLRKKK